MYSVYIHIYPRYIHKIYITTQNGTRLGWFWCWMEWNKTRSLPFVSDCLTEQKAQSLGAGKSFGLLFDAGIFVFYYLKKKYINFCEVGWANQLFIIICTSTIVLNNLCAFYGNQLCLCTFLYLCYATDMNMRVKTRRGAWQNFRIFFFIV